MKTEAFIRKDGTTGEKFEGEAGDEFTCTFQKVGVRQNPAIVKGKAIIINNYFLGVKTKDGEEITLKITDGQRKVLEKTSDLTGKTIVFEKYKHPKYGDMVGARVKK
jgi:hypothetical protein